MRRRAECRPRVVPVCVLTAPLRSLSSTHFYHIPLLRLITLILFAPFSYALLSHISNQTAFWVDKFMVGTGWKCGREEIRTGEDGK